MSNSQPIDDIFYRMVVQNAKNATAKVTDSLEELELLETLVFNSRTALPPNDFRDYHSLLVTPFYTPPFPGGSRFGGEQDPGVFYCAAELSTVAAERGYYAYRFSMDALEFDNPIQTAHTLITVAISTQMVDVRLPPFKRNQDIFLDKENYIPTQAFANLVRNTEVNAIQYASVRNPTKGICLALLNPSGFKKASPLSEDQNWNAIVFENKVRWVNNSLMKHEPEMEFSF